MNFEYELEHVHARGHFQRIRTLISVGQIVKSLERLAYTKRGEFRGLARFFVYAWRIVVPLRIPEMPEEGEKTEKIEILEELEEIPPTEPKTQQTGLVWTPEIIKDLEKFFTDLLGKNLVDKFLTLKKDEAEAERRYFQTVSTHNRRMIYILVSFLSVVVAFMTVLTVYGPVSGDALLFLVGTITGYILLFIQRLVFPSKETPPTEEQE